MADQNAGLDIDDINEGDGINKTELRIKELSNKVKLTSKERDDLSEAKKIAEAEKDAAIKERDFYQSFADVAGQYPSSKEHKEEIKAKVLAGYSVEDATVSVLNKAGKLSTPNVERQSPSGGSASTAVTSEKKKNFNDMNRNELRSEFEKAIANGDIRNE